MANQNTGIQISLTEVSQTAKTIRTLNNSLEAKLNDIKTQMNNLSSTWQSDASSSIRTNFNNMANKQFPTYKKIIEAYAAFLDGTVGAYNAAEEANKKNADMFK